MKKIAAAGLAFAMLASLLADCSGGKSGGDAAKGTSSNGATESTAYTHKSDPVVGF
jgi:hypothetical protein